MKILTRYMLRSHLGPFLYAFIAVTGLLFVNAVAQRLERLAGRGLEWSVILEFMYLSLPHIVALTFPMAILVAVLYTFSMMAADNEITAMASGGIHPGRLIIPLLGVGMIMAGGMLFFNDRILPEANHRLSTLLGDLARQSPTFELREEVVNRIETDTRETFYLQASSIDPRENQLTDVVIYDASQSEGRRTIRAREGSMYFNEERTDLFLDLLDGTIHHAGADRPGGFQATDFERQRILFRGVGDAFERGEQGRRGTREMTLGMLASRAEENRTRIAETVQQSRLASEVAVYRALGLNLPERYQGMEMSEALEAAGLEDAVGGLIPDEEMSVPEEALARNPELEEQLHDEEARGPPDEELQDPQDALPAGVLPPDEITGQLASNHRTNASRVNHLLLRAYSYEVEIHKKWAIALACLIFILLAPPLAIRFPRGGVGMVIAVSVSIFFLYWMGLIGGERLAERGLVRPVVAMWAPNVLLLLPALILLSQMARGVTTPRSGGGVPLGHRLASLMTRLRRGAGRPVAAGEASADPEREPEREVDAPERGPVQRQVREPTGTEGAPRP